MSFSRKRPGCGRKASTLPGRAREPRENLGSSRKRAGGKGKKPCPSGKRARAAGKREPFPPSQLTGDPVGLRRRGATPPRYQERSSTLALGGDEIGARPARLDARPAAQARHHLLAGRPLDRPFDFPQQVLRDRHPACAARASSFPCTSSGTLRRCAISVPICAAHVEGIGPPQRAPARRGLAVPPHKSSDANRMPERKRQFGRQVTRRAASRMERTGCARQGGRGMELRGRVGSPKFGGNTKPARKPRRISSLGRRQSELP